MVVAACEAILLKRILKDLGIPLTDPIRLFCDNMSSMYLARNPDFHTRTKHIEVHYHFIRERIQVREINLQHISTNLQVADIFTKPLGVDKVGQFASGLGLMTSALPSLRGSTVSVRKRVTFPYDQVLNSSSMQARVKDPFILALLPYR